MVNNTIVNLLLNANQISLFHERLRDKELHLETCRLSLVIGNPAGGDTIVTPGSLPTQHGNP